MNTRQFLLLLVSIALVSSPLAGCLKGKEPIETKSVDQTKAEDLLGNSGQQKFEDLAALIPKNYSFPGQKLLPKHVVTIDGKTSSTALGSYEGQRDEGGVEYRTVTEWTDISQHIPVGQPVEMFIKLWWDGKEGNSADLDIAIDVPGLKTSYSDVSEDFNWNFATKSMVVNTIGVSGQPAAVGVQIASGAVTEGFAYRLDVEFTYVKDVLTPYHPWAFNVPEGASGIILESERASGDEHVSAKFVVIDPNDNLVQYVDYNDIDIPTQSIFIPTKGKGTYVFYAHEMHGGFLRMKADSPLEMFDAQPLGLAETSAIDQAGPAPGVAGKDVTNGGGLVDGSALNSDVNPTVKNFDITGTFPLRVTGYIKGPASTMAKTTISSPSGVVHTLTSILRYEDESGSIGYTSQHSEGTNNVFDPANIQKGSWKVELVNNGPVEIGHTILTYSR